MNRRGFLGSILAACAAPAIVRADSLMRIVPTETTVLVSLPSAADVESRLLMAADDLTLTLDEFSRQYIEPSMRKLAEQIEREAVYGTLRVRLPNSYLRRAA